MAPLFQQPFMSGGFPSMNRAAGVLFTDAFSTNIWTYNGTQESYNTTNMSFSIPSSSGSSDYAVYDIGETFAASGGWYLDYTINVSSYAGSGNTVGLYVGLSSNSSTFANTYAIEFAGDTTKYTYCLANTEFVDASFAWSTSTNYFIRITMASTAAKTTTFKGYSSAANRDSDTSALFSASKTPATNASNLRYLMVRSSRPTNGYTMGGTIDDVTVDLL